MRDDTLRRWSAAAVSSSALVAGCSRMRKGLSLGVSITQVYITQILHKPTQMHDLLLD
jgi:hypothetical protein